MNSKLMSQITPINPERARQWHLGLERHDGPGVVDINLGRAWEDHVRGQGVKVAIIDSGFDIAHRHFEGRFLLEKAADFDVLAQGRALGPAPSSDDAMLDIDDFGRVNVTVDKVINGSLKLDLHYENLNFKDNTQDVQKRAARILYNKLNAHGTATTGLVAANNIGGFTGIAPECMIVPIRISTNYQPIPWIKALLYAAANADIILLPRSLPRDADPALHNGNGATPEISHDTSNGQTERKYWQLLHNVVTEIAVRCPLICAAGNDGTQRLVYPANISETLAVGACNEFGYRSTYSNFGENLDLVAPSNDSPVRTRQFTRSDVWDDAGNVTESMELGRRAISTTDNSGRYGYNRAEDEDGDYCEPENGSGFGGTSASAAIVAGVVALMMSADDLLSPADIKTLLKGTANFERIVQQPDEWLMGDAPEATLEFGKGIVDAGAAVLAALAARAAR